MYEPAAAAEAVMQAMAEARSTDAAQLDGSSHWIDAKEFHTESVRASIVRTASVLQVYCKCTASVADALCACVCVFFVGAVPELGGFLIAKPAIFGRQLPY